MFCRHHGFFCLLWYGARVRDVGWAQAARVLAHSRHLGYLLGHGIFGAHFPAGGADLGPDVQAGRAGHDVDGLDLHLSAIAPLRDLPGAGARQIVQAHPRHDYGRLPRQEVSVEKVRKCRGDHFWRRHVYGLRRQVERIERGFGQRGPYDVLRRHPSLHLALLRWWHRRVRGQAHAQRARGPVRAHVQHPERQGHPRVHLPDGPQRGQLLLPNVLRDRSYPPAPRLHRCMRPDLHLRHHLQVRSVDVRHHRPCA
mmetsp:Transcript_17662/g.46160  ORF Transcript_17662/g.46160 Transcript_17662/m.46160 type:complete len:254 (-) Transcript_17662:402-1163(-)